MALRLSRPASIAALAAAFGMAATPAAAAELPQFGASTVQVETGAPGAAHQYGYRGYDRYDRYDRHRYRHRDRGIDTGDVIAGVVVLGALAAIIGSNREHRRDRERREDYREQVRYDARDRGADYERRGIERAVDMCIDEVERYDDRVQTIDEARRAPDGWHVAGTFDEGSGWSCTIDNDGRVSDVVFEGDGYAASGDGGYYGYDQAPRGQGQLSDTDYARARATTATPASQPYGYREEPDTSAPQPAYPGGPLPGEEGYDPDWQVDGDLDRYGG